MDSISDLQARYLHVIIPVYNCRDYLEQAVCSVLNQPYDEIRIVLVDDGSTDGSSDLCDRLAQKYGRIQVIHKENGGVSRARNVGIAYVLSSVPDGGYIGFLDSDDIWCPDVITRELLDTAAEKHPDAVLSFASSRGDEQLTRFSNPVVYRHETKTGRESIWELQRCHFAASIYPMALLQKYGIRFEEGLKYSEDKIFQMQCAALSARVQFFPTCLYIHRTNRHSAMQRMKRMPALEYYTPIIDGWLRSDAFINSVKSSEDGPMQAGYALATIYMLEMTSAFYEQGSNRKTLEAVLFGHPYYFLLQNMNPQEVSEAQYKKYRLLLEHPKFYALKYRIRGVALRTAQLIAALPFVQALRDKRRYPNTTIPR